jgi:hypothetical protein
MLPCKTTDLAIAKEIPVPHYLANVSLFLRPRRCTRPENTHALPHLFHHRYQNAVHVSWLVRDYKEWQSIQALWKPSAPEDKEAGLHHQR